MEGLLPTVLPRLVWSLIYYGHRIECLYSFLHKSRSLYTYYWYQSRFSLYFCTTICLFILTEWRGRSVWVRASWRISCVRHRLGQTPPRSPARPSRRPSRWRPSPPPAPAVKGESEVTLSKSWFYCEVLRGKITTKVRLKNVKMNEFSSLRL